ncbi:hypothetical protein [Halorubrum sp. Boch-26]|uniref:hypothetical protein n=1 Tax=Halorubrum sp. Boch-26 TaxID=2994426 RepID=UPI00246847DF|nr:hypothetical protein [Halorubrum sp. Boch-26]
MRVVVAENLEVRAGQAFNDDGSVKSNHPSPNGNSENYVEYASNTSFFDAGPNGGLEDIDTDDLPVATVNRRDQNVNGDVKIQVATNVDTTTVTFTDILEIENKGTDAVKVGISYDRNANQYGDDVNVGGDPQTEITQQTVQHIYRLIGHGTGTFGSGRISPDQSDTSDDPANVAEIGSGETIPVDLKVDLNDMFGFLDVQSQITDEATLNGDPFQGRIDTVDLLDEITVGIEDPDNPF